MHDVTNPSHAAPAENIGRCWQSRKRTTSIEILATIQDDLGRLSFPPLEHDADNNHSSHHDPQNHQHAASTSPPTPTASNLSRFSKSMLQREVHSAAHNNNNTTYISPPTPTFPMSKKQQHQTMAPPAAPVAPAPTAAVKSKSKHVASLYPSLYQLESSLLTAPDISLDQLFQQAQSLSAQSSSKNTRPQNIRRRSTLDSSGTCCSSSSSHEHNSNSNSGSSHHPQTQQEKNQRDVRVFSSSCPELDCINNDAEDASVAALLADNLHEEISAAAATADESSSSSSSEEQPHHDVHHHHSATPPRSPPLPPPPQHHMSRAKESQKPTSLDPCTSSSNNSYSMPPPRPSTVTRAHSAATGPASSSNSMRGGQQHNVDYNRSSSSSTLNGSHRRRATMPSVQHERPIVDIEVAPGVYKTLRRSDETVAALERGIHAVVTCFACNVALGTVPDCELVICPDCRVLSPMTNNINDDATSNDEYYERWGNASIPSLSPSSCTGDGSSVWSLSDRGDDYDDFSSPPLSPLQGERIRISCTNSPSVVRQVHLQQRNSPHQKVRQKQQQQPSSSSAGMVVRYGIGLGVKMQ